MLFYGLKSVVKLSFRNHRIRQIGLYLNGTGPAPQPSSVFLYFLLNRNDPGDRYIPLADLYDFPRIKNPASIQSTAGINRMFIKFPCMQRIP